MPIGAATEGPALGTRLFALALLACWFPWIAATGYGQTAGSASAPEADGNPPTLVEQTETSSPTSRQEGSGSVGETIQWKPFPVPQSGRVELWRLPLQRLVVHPNKEDTRRHPWFFSTGPPHRRSFVKQIHDEHGAPHDAVAAYCFRSWDVGGEGPATALVEFPLQLPESSPVQLRAVMAFRDPAGEGKRSVKPGWCVRVLPFEAPAGELGRMVFAWEAEGEEWQKVIVDLSDFAGRAIRLQLTVPPGKGHRHVYWVEPTLIAGHPKAGKPWLRNSGKKPN